MPRQGLARMSQARTISAAEFDLTHADSDVEGVIRAHGFHETEPRTWTRCSSILDEPHPAVPRDVAVDDEVDDTESVDTSVQGDSEDTETLAEVEVSIRVG